MNPGADVHAIEALEDWHNALCLFREDATESLSSIALEIRRAFDWIDEEQKGWVGDVRDAEEEVAQAKLELSRRKTPDFSGRIPDTSVQEEKLARAKARLRFAEDQVEVCRKWAAKLPKLINEEYDGPSRRLGDFLETELPAAIAHLNARILSLHKYTEVKPTEVAAPERKPEAPS